MLLLLFSSPFLSPVKFLFSAGNWLQSLALSRQALYHWDTSLFFFFWLFVCSSGRLEIRDLPASASDMLGFRACATMCGCQGAVLICHSDHSSSHFQRSDKFNVSGQVEEQRVSVISPIKPKEMSDSLQHHGMSKRGFLYLFEGNFGRMLVKYFPTQGALVNCSIHLQFQWTFLKNTCCACARG